MFRDDPAYAGQGRARSRRWPRDITEFMSEIGLAPPSVSPTGLTRRLSSRLLAAARAARSATQPKELLKEAGFTVLDPPEGHLCCGSAGTYNILQPEIATALRDRKVANIESRRPDVIAAGNIGCITQIADGTTLPVVHTVELLDWATGGPKPAGLS